MKKQIKIIIILVALFTAIPLFAQNNTIQGHPDEGYTTKATKLYADPSTGSQVISNLKSHQQVDIKSVSNDNKFFYVEIDQQGPDIHGWVLKSDVYVTEYENHND